MTAVDFLENNYTTIGIDYYYFVQATKMFKQQIKDAYNQGYRDGHEDGQFTIFPAFQDVAEFSNAENYYNETFKNEN